jgi:hypothetical protein
MFKNFFITVCEELVKKISSWCVAHWSVSRRAIEWTPWLFWKSWILTTFPVHNEHLIEIKWKDLLTSQFLSDRDTVKTGQLEETITVKSRGCTTRTGYFKCREVKTGFYRNKSMQTGTSGTLIGWKSGQTTFVPLWDRMEGAWLRTQDENTLIAPF